jgi:hypothetical protein
MELGDSDLAGGGLRDSISVFTCMASEKQGLSLPADAVVLAM